VSLLEAREDWLVVYVVLADLVVALHAAYIGFVVFGFAAILLGIAMGWRWVRNVYFRAGHLGAILLVYLEAVTGVFCPLTILENRLRVLGAGAPYPGAFVGHLLDRLIFYNFPQRVFTIAYLSFGALVLLSFVLAPPWHSRSPNIHHNERNSSCSL